MPDRSELIYNRLHECIFNGEINNEYMLKIFNLTSDYLNMESIKERSDRLGISPQAIYKSKINYINKFGIKIIFDN